jgi:UDPglucose 6-dehydrogenase
MADLGHEVLAIDVDRQKIAKAASGEVPFFEPVLGIAFKPNSDDIRDSPSLDICGRLAAEGAMVSVHDPVAMPNAARTRPDLRYAASASEAAEGADVVLHLTEWADYRAIDPAALATVVRQRAIIDARCALDTQAWQEAGWTVRVLGRP